MTTTQHTYGPSCRLAYDGPSGTLSPDAPPPMRAQFFYQSSLAIDDPLSPIPPPTGTTSTVIKYPLRPFAVRDNAALEEVWQGLNEKDEVFDQTTKASAQQNVQSDDKERASSSSTRNENYSLRWANNAAKSGVSNEELRGGNRQEAQKRPQSANIDATERDIQIKHSQNIKVESGVQHPIKSHTTGAAALSYPPSKRLLAEKTTSGTPFIRAPSQRRLRSGEHRKGDDENTADDDDEGSNIPSPSGGRESVPDSRQETSRNFTTRDSSKEPVSEKHSENIHIPVGISRLHYVELPDLDMKPIYWSPVNDIATVVRGTWFYRDTMLPVTADVANQLERGYLELKPWTETWTDELNSAVAVGPEGESKVMHRIWPLETQKKDRPGNADVARVSGTVGGVVSSDDDRPRSSLSHHRGLKGLNHVAAEARPETTKDKVRRYAHSRVLYRNQTEAFILRPNLLPSAYYGRRPVAKIRKGVTVGIPVVRGFDWRAWHKLHPVRITTTWTRAQEGAASSASGTAGTGRTRVCGACWLLEQPQNVTDLVLVIHGIGQKLSERIESFHFTHLVNSFRRQIHVELGNPAVRGLLRPGHGGTMTLPINWRSTLSFEDGGPPTADQRDRASPPPPINDYGLKDITPNTLPAIRNLISDVMLDIPYYLSHHKPKMIEAVIREANRVYRLWCKNNPGFEKHGRVHLIAHSLGSVMALDILSNQPTNLPQESPLLQPMPSTKIFEFDTKSLFFCGSPAGFFLLLNRASLLPRKGRNKPGAEDEDIGPGVVGEEGTYGCLAVDNLYNVMHHLDPITYRLNGTVDKDYAASLKPAFVPTASTPLLESLGNAFRYYTSSTSSSSTTEQQQQEHQSNSRSTTATTKPNRRLPSNIELDIHDFSKEEIAEKKMLLLNEDKKGDIDKKIDDGGPQKVQSEVDTFSGSPWLPDRFEREAVKGYTKDDGNPPTQTDDSEKDCKTHEDAIDGEDTMIEE
ncbi:MAG: hypothetical protein M1823_002057 [Watsoniomyces obsoletus]|nr:MAG: hypothetical protein M1823_002057 [Watsoniomyces obsoletus]